MNYKKIVGEQPSPHDPVTLPYLYNHMFQVLTWVNYLNKDQDEDMALAAQHIQDAQALIAKVTERTENNG